MCLPDKVRVGIDVGMDVGTCVGTKLGWKTDAGWQASAQMWAGSSERGRTGRRTSVLHD